MYLRFLVFMFTLCLSMSVFAERESYYRDRDCNDRQGIAESRNTDGTYTDCLTPDLAIEYDFANKWYECISQAGHYAILTDRQGACVLIYKSDNDIRYLIRATRFTTEYMRKPIPILVIQ